MDFEQAKELVLRESLGEHGIVVCARIGEDPGPERMRAVTEAVRAIFEHMRGESAISRRVACALYSLAFYTDTGFNASLQHGMKFRDDLFDPELLLLQSAVESVFADELIEYLQEK